MRGLFKKFTPYVKPKNLAEIAERSRAAIEDTSAAGVNIVKTRFVGPLPESVSVSDKDVASAIAAIEAQKLAALGNIQNAYIGGVSRVKSAHTRAGASIIAGIGAGLFGFFYLKSEEKKLDKEKDELRSEKYIASVEREMAKAFFAVVDRKRTITDDFLKELVTTNKDFKSDDLDSLNNKLTNDPEVIRYRKLYTEAHTELTKANTKLKRAGMKITFEPGSITLSPTMK